MLGIDDEGREVLTYLEGESGTDGLAEVVDDRGLVAMARLLREYREAVAGYRPGSRMLQGAARSTGRDRPRCQPADLNSGRSRTRGRERAYLSTMLHGLHDVDWASMRHAHGSAGDVPAILRAMGSADVNERTGAMRAFRDRVFPDGDIYRCTTASLPFLFAMATDVTTPDRGGIVRLLSDIGESAVDGPADDADDLDDDEPEPDHLAAARAVTGRGDAFLGFAVDADPAVRRAAVTALPYVVDDADRTAAVIRERLPAEPGTAERILLVHTMATLAEQRPALRTGARTWLTGLADDPALDRKTRLAALINTPSRVDDLVPAMTDLLRTAPMTPEVTALLRGVHVVLGHRVPQRTVLLAQQFCNADPAVVVAAVRTAVEVMTRWRGGYSGLVQHLAGLLSSADPEIAAEAAVALRRCHPLAEPAREPLAAAVATHGAAGWTAADPGVRRVHQEAVAALARLGDPRALPSLLLAFDEGSEDYRAVTDVRALTDAAPALVPRLCRLLDRQKPLSMANETTARHALDALATLAPGRSENLVAQALDAVADFLRATSNRYLPALTVATLDAFSAFGPAAAALLPTIRELSRSTHPFVRPAAVRALWTVGGDPHEVVPMLTGIVDDDPSIGVRIAADTLAAIGRPATAALPHLRSRISDDNGWVRVPCAAAIWDLAGPPEASHVLDVLLAAWTDNPGVAYRVAAVLDRMGPAAAPAVPFLRDRLAEPARNGDIGPDEELQRTGRAIVARTPAPAEAQFLVEDVFDLPSRGGLLVTGRMLAGRIAPGQTLRDALTGTAAQVLGVEFHVPRNRPENTVTLVVGRTDPTPAVVGRVLFT